MVLPFLPLTGELLRKFNNLGGGYPQEPKLGDILNAIAVLTAYKDVDESLANSDVLQADNELTVDVLAGVTYTLQGVLFMSIPGGAGVKTGFLGSCVPASMKVQVEVYDTQLRQSGRLTALGASIDHAAVGPGDHYITVFGSIEVQTAGTFVCAWAQNAVNPAALVMQRNSSLILTPTVV